MKEYYRVKATIDLDAIYKNIENIKKMVHENTKVMAVIKADAYGHGAIPVAMATEMLVDVYGVAIIEEGIELKRAGIHKSILILGHTPKENYHELLEYDIIQTIYEYDMAAELSKESVDIGKKAKVHLKLDTGMNRIGFLHCSKSIEDIVRINQLEGIEITGAYTHFAGADCRDKEMANHQLEEFLQFIHELEEEGVSIPMKHAANSAAIIDMPEANLDMIRSGISTYGLYPSDEVNQERLQLYPALELTTNVIYVKELEAGVCVGYGATYTTTDRTIVATIPVGYGDGYPRNLSNKGRVLIHGQYAPIIGRVCMDQFMVDVTHILDVKEGDQVTLVGADGDMNISVEELSELSGTFNYEFVCDLGKRIPREYYWRGRRVGTLDYYNCTDATLDIQELSVE